MTVPRRLILSPAPSGRVLFRESRSYARLCEWTRLGRELDAVPVVNVWRSSELASCGRRRLLATGRAAQLTAELAGALVLVLGPRLTWLVWGVDAHEHEVLSVAGCRLTVIGHPSGRNRFYNVLQRRDELRAVVGRWLVDGGTLATSP